MINEEKRLGFKLIWKSYAPVKVIANAWRVLWDRLPTKTNLRRRKFLDTNSNMKCVLCGVNDESGKHFFFECSISYKVWMECFKWLGLSTVMQSNSFSNLIRNSRLLRGVQGRKVVVTLWSCIVWRLWKSRNDVIFNDADFCLDVVVEDIKARLWSWCFVKKIGCSSFSFRDWLVNPRMVLDC
ncbi:hypothetical protein OROMI_033769 [Orobanche minor]